MKLTHDIIKANLDAVGEARRECPEFDQFVKDYPSNRNTMVGAVVTAIGLQDLANFVEWLHASNRFGYSPVYESLDFQHVREQVAQRCIDVRVRDHVAGMTQRRFNNLLRDTLRLQRWNGMSRYSRHYSKNFANSEPLLINWAILNGIDIPIPQILPLGRHYTTHVVGFGQFRESYRNARLIVERFSESIPRDIPMYKVNHAYLLRSLQSILGAALTVQMNDLTAVFDRESGKVRTIERKSYSQTTCSGCGSLTGMRHNIRDKDGHLIQVDREGVVDLRLHRMDQLMSLEA